MLGTAATSKPSRIIETAGPANPAAGGRAERPHRRRPRQPQSNAASAICSTGKPVSAAHAIRNTLSRTGDYQLSPPWKAAGVAQRRMGLNRLTAETIPSTTCPAASQAALAKVSHLLIQILE